MLLYIGLLIGDLPYAFLTFRFYCILSIYYYYYSFLVQLYEN